MDNKVKLSCAKNGSVMKLVLTSWDKTALIQRYWSLYNNNATGSTSLFWINKSDASHPFCASVWTNPKRLRNGLHNALDLKYGKDKYENETEQEETETLIEKKLNSWISSIKKEEYIRFSADTYEKPSLNTKECTFDKIIIQETGALEH